LFRDYDQDPNWQFSQILSMGVLYRLADWSFPLLHAFMQQLNNPVFKSQIGHKNGLTIR
jgi:hypothetical protein